MFLDPKRQRIVHAQNAQWLVSASKMIILGIVPENPIDMPKNSILNPYVKAFSILYRWF